MSRLLKLGINFIFFVKKIYFMLFPGKKVLLGGLAETKKDFVENARKIYVCHFNQIAGTVSDLKNKYDRPIFGKKRIWDLVCLLDKCVDPSDTHLFGYSQLFHVLQVLESMERAKVEDRDLLMAAIVHDLGKLLLLTGEAPENIVCINTPIGRISEKIGLEH